MNVVIEVFLVVEDVTAAGVTTTDGVCVTTTDGCKVVVLADVTVLTRVGLVPYSVRCNF